MCERVQFGLAADVGVLEVERVLGPIGRLVERPRAPVHADAKRAACDNDALDAAGGRGFQQISRARDVDALHLLRELRPTADAHFERQVQQRVDA